jgi:glycosyltransferase involved in cell wall biosynthesis
VVFSAVEGRGRKQAQEVIVINPYVQDQIGRQLRGRCRSIENPVADELFHVIREPDARTILYVGRLSRLKNVDGLLRAFRKVVVRHPDARLRIAGMAESAAYQEACMQYVAQSDLGHAVAFLGNLDRNALVKEYAKAACLALTSRQETAPVAVAEAMAAGVPVVASRICGIPHMVDEGVDGFLIDPDNEEEIAARLCELLGNPALNRTIGEQAALKAKERFHCHSIARRTLDVYREILERKTSARKVIL